MSTERDENGRPVKGNPEYDLWLAAIEIAIAAPWKQSGSAYDAKVPWSTIDALRKALEGVGINWENGKRKDDERRNEGRPARPKLPTLAQLRQQVRDLGIDDEYLDMRGRGELEAYIEHTPRRGA